MVRVHDVFLRLAVLVHAAARPAAHQVAHAKGYLARKRAIAQLGKHLHKNAVRKALFDLAGNGDEFFALRAQAAQMLAKLGAETRSELLTILDGLHARALRSVLPALGPDADEETIEYSRNTIETSSSGYVVAAALRALSLSRKAEIRIDLEKALRLLALPRDVGPHPEDGKMITAGLGRYGPFVLHDGTYANLESIDEVFEVGVNRAVAAIADKKANGGRRGATAKALKSLGDHPDGGGEVTVNEGRYGPYVKWGKINATIPKGKDPQAITMEEAVPLLAARAEKAGIKKPAKKVAAKKTTAKSKTATKKTASSKKTAEAEKSDS